MYRPQPIDTTNVKLKTSIIELSEMLAHNAHEVWAAQRIAQGWSYGTKRNDELKHHPCLVPYEELPESEKEVDRKMAMEILKVISKLGYSIEKN